MTICFLVCVDNDTDIFDDIDDLSNDNTVNVKEMADVFNKVQSMMHKKVRKYNYDPEDLLPLFDDTCKVPGSITIATTNNPDVIMNIGTGKSKGAMIRSGRLKLFRLGYFDRDSVEQLFNIKWKNRMTIKDDWFGDNGEIKIQNSNFMDILRESTEENLYDNINKEILNEFVL